MLSDVDVAKYFINKDTDHQLFNTNLINRNGRTFYEGNARLNKLLHLAQNIYYAKTGHLLMDTTFYAYDNGAVIPEIQERYSILIHRTPHNVKFDTETTDFLDRFYKAFKNADVDELIELSHEDSEWEDKHIYFDKKSQQMDTEKHLEEYRKQYKDIIAVLDMMVL